MVLGIEVNYDKNVRPYALPVLLWMTRDEWVADDVGQSGGKQCKVIRQWMTQQSSGCG
jgi:hypothetical protein